MYPEVSERTMMELETIDARVDIAVREHLAHVVNGVNGPATVDLVAFLAPPAAGALPKNVVPLIIIIAVPELVSGDDARCVLCKGSRIESWQSGEEPRVRGRRDRGRVERNRLSEGRDQRQHGEKDVEEARHRGR